MRVLIADDEKTLTEMLKEILKQHKIDCDVVYNGQDAVYYASESEYDVIVLDIMMPVMDGYKALEQMRKAKVATPILMLSAKSETRDKVMGLDIGADDYMTKPFVASELVARIKALARRKGEYLGNKLEHGDLVLCKDSFALNCKGQSIVLSSTEYKILELLFLNCKNVVEKDRLIEKVWGWEHSAGYNNAEVYISFLRKKLQALGSNVFIKAIRGVGYKLEVFSD